MEHSNDYLMQFDRQLPTDSEAQKQADAFFAWSEVSYCFGI